MGSQTTTDKDHTERMMAIPNNTVTIVIRRDGYKDQYSCAELSDDKEMNHKSITIIASVVADNLFKDSKAYGKQND